MNFDKTVKKFSELKKSLEKEIVKRRKKGIQATMPEGAKEDVLNTNITGSSVSTTDLKRNSYKTYTGTTQKMYDMYNGTTDFGAEFLGSVVATRSAFICGGGISVISENEKVAESINAFLKYNHLLQGSKLFANVEIGELAGKDLMVLKPNNKTEKIDVNSFYSVPNPYQVDMDEKDNQKIKDVTYQSENEKKGQSIAPESNLVYVKLGGTPDKVNETMPVIGRCLTQIENASRILYDLRYNNHLYGKLTLCFQTQDKQDASALSKTLVSENWSPGKAYCGTAKHYIVGPPPEAVDVLSKELIENCRIISINTGIPIHWLSYPELMSNRSTAETMIEVINAATAKARELWQEAFTELVLKAGRIAFLRGYKKTWPFNIDNEKFEIRLPLISIALLKQIQETWIPLAEMGYITRDSVRNKVPGINPVFEKKGLEAEKEERISKIANKFGNDFSDNHEHEEDTEMEEEV